MSFRFPGQGPLVLGCISRHGPCRLVYNLPFLQAEMQGPQLGVMGRSMTPLKIHVKVLGGLACIS